MIIVTIKFQSNSIKTYDYVFYSDKYKHYTINKELPVRLVMGSSYGTPVYSFITFVSCKKVDILPPYVTSALTLVGDNMVVSGKLSQEQIRRAQKTVVKAPTVKPKDTHVSIKSNVTSTRKQRVHKQLLIQIQTEIDHITFLLTLQDDYVYSKEQLSKQLQTLQRRKQKYESEV